MAFEQLYNIYSQINGGEIKGWKKRNYQERTVVFNEYIILKIEGIMKGGYSLLDGEINGVKGKVLECIFSKETGVGDIILNNIKRVDGVFAYSSNREFFIENGFKLVEGKVSETGAELFVWRK